MSTSSSVVEQIVEELESGGSSALYDQLWAVDYERHPVSIRQFIEDDYYLGSSVKDLSEKWKVELEDVFDPVDPVLTLILTGAIGTGKTTVAIISMLYKIYLLSCLHDPASFYGLLPGSRIVFGIFNITLNKADTGYDFMKRLIDASPYFTDVCPRKLRPDEPIVFPKKNVVVEIGSLAEHALGENLFAFEMDEANFFTRTANPSEKTRAHQLFGQAKIRLVSRYMRYGVLPGLIIIISSRKYETDFLEEQIKEAEEGSIKGQRTKVVSLALWETKPKTIYSGDLFRVMVGSETVDSRILEEDELATSGLDTVTIPIEYKGQFELDVEASLRDIAGITTVGTHNFFSNRQLVYQCIDSARRHPLTVQEVSNVGLGTGNTLSELIDVRCLCSVVKSQWAPKVDPKLPRYAHVDLAITQDSIGLCVAHVQKRSGVSVAYIDLLARITAPVNREIDLESTVHFFEYMRELGYKFDAISFDQFQSRLAIQMLQKKRFGKKPAARAESFKRMRRPPPPKAPPLTSQKLTSPQGVGLMSIQLEHYVMARRLMAESRVNVYHYEPLLREIINLRKGEDSKRPEHPIGGSDDVCDAFVGAVYHCAAMMEIGVEIPKHGAVRSPPLWVGTSGNKPLLPVRRV